MHCKNVIFDFVWIPVLSKNHPKAFVMFPTSITACKNHANFFSTMFCAIWLLDFWPLRYLLNMYQFDCSVIRFPISNSWNKSTKIHFLFYFPFCHLKNNEINEKKLKKPTVGISQENSQVLLPGDWEIWWKTWRLPGKPGELAGMRLFSNN